MSNQQTDPLAQKKRRGISRILHATGYSMSGLKLGMQETAFRQEVWLAAVLIPAAFFVGRTVLEVLALIGAVFLVLITELLNTGIESAIDRVSTEYHELSKRAKDLGSAAVFLSLAFCVLTWLMVGLARIAT